MNLQQIDNILLDISSLKRKIEEVRTQWDRAISELEKQYGAQLNGYKEQLRQKEKELIRISKQNISKIFDGSDRREFKNGVLYLQTTERVRRVRSVTTELLKQLGYNDGIKVIEKVDWEKIERWPDEKLVAIGTERVRNEEIKYELKEGGK